ncbi:MAG: hypothetical protein BAJALOKI1v1_1730006 [Promethearchaeota archaeon]|nr:MAG: hypothetical protein BAJALOKI1v1_1730006 [Candidatus Lokiarchaeota archaeon]
MSDSIQQSCNKIKEFLSIPEDNTELEAIFEERDNTEDFKQDMLDNMYRFIQHFAMFKDIKPFMKSVFVTLKKTLEFQTQSLDDFEELLIRNSLMRFIQEYITYSKISQQEKVLSLLTESLGKLQLGPLIINLGLLIKPMYEDNQYVEKIEEYEEIEVSYVLNSEEEIQIKKQVDKWLETQDISLSSQDQLEGKLEEKYNELISNCGLSGESDQCKKLWEEVLEMLRMKLTVISLMASLPEEEEVT